MRLLQCRSRQPIPSRERATAGRRSVQGLRIPHIEQHSEAYHEISHGTKTSLRWIQNSMDFLI